MKPSTAKSLLWVATLSAAIAASMLLTGCAKHGGASSVDKAMDQSGV